MCRKKHEIPGGRGFNFHAPNQRGLPHQAVQLIVLLPSKLTGQPLCVGIDGSFRSAWAFPD